MTNVHVSLKNVTKQFQREGSEGVVHALGPLDLELRSGEFFAVVGPSGCGKSSLLEVIAGLWQGVCDQDSLDVPSRIVWLPLSWDDPACQKAIDKYMTTVRQDAPWCPSNIEFIRRMNGLESQQEVFDIVHAASYLVLGLGDVYLGAPVATPVEGGGILVQPNGSDMGIWFWLVQPANSRRWPTSMGA